MKTNEELVKELKTMEILNIVLMFLVIVALVLGVVIGIIIGKI